MTRSLGSRDMRHSAKVFTMSVSQLGKLSRLERGSSVVRNLAFHRTHVLEPVRRVAFRNMQFLGRAMSVHPKPDNSGMNSPQARSWVKSVQNQMLTYQGLEPSELNRGLLHATTFMPVKIYTALWYAELEYLEQHCHEYPLAGSSILGKVLRKEAEFITASKEFRHGMLHPQPSSDRFEDRWLDRAFHNQLPQLQQAIDAVTTQAKGEVHSDVQSLLFELTDVQRWSCIANFASAILADDAVLIDGVRYEQFEALLLQLDEDFPRIRRETEKRELSPEELRVVRRVVKCMTNLHDWGVPVLDETILSGTPPRMRAGFFKRAEFIEGSPYTLIVQNRHSRAVAANLGHYAFLLDAAGVFLNESRAAVPGLEAAIEQGDTIDQLVAHVGDAPLPVRHAMTGLGNVVDALLYGILEAYRSVCTENPSMGNELVSPAIADGQTMTALKLRRNAVFHVAHPSSDPYQVEDLATQLDPDYRRNLFTGLSMFLGSMSQYRPPGSPL